MFTGDEEPRTGEHTMSTTYGTCHFTSFFAAAKYYEAYGYSSRDVTAKFNLGEIKLGRPTLKADETCRADRDGRYHVTVKSA